MRKILAIFGLASILLLHVVAATNSYYGIVTVATAGSAVQVAPGVGYSSISCMQVIVTADPANTGKLYIGMGSDVTSSKYFAALSANGSFNSGPSGDKPRFPCQDLWINTDVNGTKADVLILPGEVKQ